jgi:hypothetical protein
MDLPPMPETKRSLMAIAVEVVVPRATRHEADAFDDAVGAAIMEMGAPPPGLLVHFARPEGAGFLLCSIWRSEDDMRAFLDEVILASLSQAGLEPTPPRTHPVWAFARP